MEEIQKSLVELGLTTLQARILILLQKIENASVKNISKELNVHRQQIYPTLTALDKMGFLERKLGRPNRYISLSLKEIFKLLLEDKTKWITDIKQKTSELTQKFDQKKKSSDDEYSFKLISGKAHFGRESRQWLQESQKVDMVIIFDALSKYLGEELEIDKVKYRKNMKFRIVTCANPDNEAVKRSQSRGTEVRFIKSDIPVEVAVFDKSRAHLCIFSNRNNVHTAEIACLTSNHPCFVAMIQNYFDVLWNIAKP